MAVRGRITRSRFGLLVPFVGAVALVLGTSAGPRVARADNQPEGIHVRAQGVVTARPDLAIVGMGASVRRESAGEAFARANSLIASVTDSLRAAGVEERDIQTRQFSLNPEYGRSPDGSSAPIIGWRATNTLTVKIRDFTRIGRIIDDATRILGNEVTLQGISFAIEDTDALARQARTAAIDEARTRAQEMAARAGVRVGRLLYLNEVSAPPPTPQARAVSAAAPTTSFAAPAPGVEVAPGEQSITVIVEAVFAIE